MGNEQKYLRAWSEVLYRNIQGRCRADGITICKLERAVGFGNGTIHKWKVRTPGLDYVKAVADYFGTGIDELLLEVEPAEILQNEARYIEEQAG